MADPVLNTMITIYTLDDGSKQVTINSYDATNHVSAKVMNPDDSEHFADGIAHFLSAPDSETEAASDETEESEE